MHLPVTKADVELSVQNPAVMGIIPPFIKVQSTVAAVTL
jgi:hypothetical protein